MEAAAGSIAGGCDDDDWVSGVDSVLEVVRPSDRRLNAAASVLATGCVNYNRCQSTRARFVKCSTVFLSVSILMDILQVDLG